MLVPHYEPRYHRAQLWTISFPAGEARRFTNDLSHYGSNLDTTHDGTKLAAVVAAAVSNVWVVPVADPSKGQQITSNGPSLFEVAQDAESKILAASEDGELWSMNTDGSKRTAFGQVHEAGPNPSITLLAEILDRDATRMLCGAHSISQWADVLKFHTHKVNWGLA